MMKRTCPNCSDDSVSVSALILSDVQCSSCGRTIGVQTLFRAIFFLLTLIATVALGLAVLVDQGVYAALLVITLPVGAIGYVKARFCPLVIRNQLPGAERTEA